MAMQIERKLFPKIEYGWLILGRDPDCFTILPATGPNRFTRFPRAVALQLHYAVR